MMNEKIETVREYWDKRYGTEGKIWGDQPSLTAKHALSIFQKSDMKRVLVPGSGYGRHTAFFAMAGYDVTGIEISPVAINMAYQYDRLSHFHQASVLEMSAVYGQFDAIYCFNVLHLFLEPKRALFIKRCEDRLAKSGLMFFTVFSEKEADYGKGTAVEPNTFETRPGRPAHYFTEDDLRRHFARYAIKDIGIIEESEDHGGKPHTHFLRYICAGLDS
jgi:2-polyprenyl-3-methyl-5-hydroxy-6-metoxy-1,4-benzoquinol methylase